MQDVPVFPAVGAPPDPGLEGLASLQAIEVPTAAEGAVRMADIEGARRNALWEAVFLFQKCSHTNLAAQRLGQVGMHSWCMFNAYHSAYLGARGILGLLGVALPRVKGSQVAIDFFPQPDSYRPGKRLATEFQECLVLSLGQLDQRYLWEAFQRLLNVTDIACVDLSVKQALLDLPYDEITPARNSFLYKAHFWPLGDMTVDLDVTALQALVGTSLDTEDEGFLMRLSFSVYKLFEQLIQNLGESSAVIKLQVEGSRCIRYRDVADLDRYREFTIQLSSSASTPQE